MVDTLPPILQRDRVHAVAQSRWRRTVIEHVAEVRAATRAGDLDAKKRGSVLRLAHSFFADRLKETRPASTGVKLRVGSIERIAASRADVSAGAMLECVPVVRRRL